MSATLTPACDASCVGTCERQQYVPDMYRERHSKAECVSSNGWIHTGWRCDVHRHRPAPVARPDDAPWTVFDGNDAARPRCDFCHKSPREKVLLERTRNTAICAGCSDLAASLLDDRTVERAGWLDGARSLLNRTMALYAPDMVGTAAGKALLLNICEWIETASTSGASAAESGPLNPPRQR